MINNAVKRKKKIEKLLEITNISEKQLDKLNYKEKQQYYMAKRKLCNIIFVSRDKDGKGITYKKSKETEYE